MVHAIQLAKGYTVQDTGATATQKPWGQRGVGKKGCQEPATAVTAFTFLPWLAMLGYARGLQRGRESMDTVAVVP